MEKLSVRKRGAIVRDYLSGLPYREIAARQHVSIGAVTGVVADLKEGRFPEAGAIAEDIEQLKELSVDLKKANLTPGQCALGFMVMARIKECGLEPSDIDRWPLILKSVANEDEAQRFVKMVYDIQEVEKRTGLDLDALDNKARELERKAADLEPVSERLKESEKQLAKLAEQREELTSAVVVLKQKCELLTPRVKDLEKREQSLSRRIGEMEPKAKKAEATLSTLNSEIQKLNDVGLSLRELADFNDRLQVIAQQHTIKPAQLKSRLLHELETIDKVLRLEMIIENRQQDLEGIEQNITITKKEIEATKAATGALSQEKANLEASIKVSREKVSREIAQIIPLAQDTINRLGKELKRVNEEALANVNQLREKALETGKEVGRYEEVLRSNQWLSDLLSLVKGEERLNSKSVRAIVLLVLRGTSAWFKHNHPDDARFSIMPYTLDSLIKEMEQWEA
ncbi:hypothetical protein ACFLUK_01750 [Chloroflexota bacterium]